MELTDLQVCIQSGAIVGTTIFSGPEGAVQRVYIEHMAKAINAVVVRCDSVSAAIRAMSARTLTPEKRLFVVFDDVAFTKAEKAWPKAFARVVDLKQALVLQYSKLDKRLKFSKQNKDIICEFDTLGKDIAVKYIQRELPGLSENTAYDLADACACDYGRILSECDKVRHYYAATKDMQLQDGEVWDITEAAATLIHEGVIYQPIGDITFSLTDSVLLRNVSAAEKYLAQAIQKGEPALVVLTVLYNQFRAMLMVQGLGVNKSNAAQRTGLSGWQVKMAMDKMGHYRIAELVRNLRRLQALEYGIKTGKADQFSVLSLAVVSCLEEAA